MMQPNKTKLTIKEGHAIAADYYQSKLKPKVFCFQKNIPYHILKYWRDQYDKCASANKSSAKFLPIKLLPKQPVEATTFKPLKIIVNNNFTIEITDNIDLAMLKNVLDVCKTCG